GSRPRVPYRARGRRPARLTREANLRFARVGLSSCMHQDTVARSPERISLPTATGQRNSTIALRTHGPTRRPVARAPGARAASAGLYKVLRSRGESACSLMGRVEPDRATVAGDVATGRIESGHSRAEAHMGNSVAGKFVAGLGVLYLGSVAA